MTDLSGLEETIEAAARALCDPPSRRIDWQPHYDEMPEEVKDDLWRNQARAALTAALAVNPPQIVRAELHSRVDRQLVRAANTEGDLLELAAAARAYRDIKLDVSYRQLAGHPVSNNRREELRLANERLNDALLPAEALSHAGGSDPEQPESRSSPKAVEYQRHIAAETIHELQRERDGWHVRAEKAEGALARLRAVAEAAQDLDRRTT